MVLVALELCSAGRAGDSLQVLLFAGPVDTAARAVAILSLAADGLVEPRPERGAALGADLVVLRLPVDPGVLAVLRMPGEAFFRAVPLGSERTYPVKVFEEVLFLPGLVTGMDDAVLGERSTRFDGSLLNGFSSSWWTCHLSGISSPGCVSSQISRCRYVTPHGTLRW